MHKRKLWNIETENNYLFAEVGPVIRGMNIFSGSNGSNYYRVGKKFYPNIQNWPACSNICQADPKCAAWIWHHENSGQYKYKCVTVTSFQFMTRDDNCISGYKN